MSDSAELWMVGISVAAAVVPWAMSIHAKVAVIARSVEELPALIKELSETLEEHEVRLNRHDEEIKTLKGQTNSSS
jgi:hypothetical protein